MVWGVIVSLPGGVSDWIKNMDLGGVLESNPHYMGYNPFSDAFGFDALGPVSINENISYDTIGIVYNTYFLASKLRQEKCL